MRGAEHWQPAPNNLSLPENIVHVWRAELVAASAGLLSPDERERAAQFHFDKDRNCYIAARSILRRLIGRYENIPPQKVQFTYNSFGKPELSGSSLRFNTSHSAALALFTFARNRNVGVDLERIRPEFSSREIASQFFAPEEIAAMRALADDEQRRAFFNCWTRKEAFIKAHGSGLSLPLHKFVVSLDHPARLVRTDFDPAALGQWILHHLEIDEGFAAALAIEGTPDRIDCWQWR